MDLIEKFNRLFEQNEFIYDDYCIVSRNLFVLRTLQKLVNVQGKYLDHENTKDLFRDYLALVQSCRGIYSFSPPQLAFNKNNLYPDPYNVELIGLILSSVESIISKPLTTKTFALSALKIFKYHSILMPMRFFTFQ